MNYNKIGEFIMHERKAKKLTQAKLAEKLFVSEKTISKWENGKGVPSTDILKRLCEIFSVSINELLNGERISSEKYFNKAENKLLELKKVNEQNNKRFLLLEIILCSFGCLFILFALFMLLYIKEDLPLWIKIMLVVICFISALVTFFISLKIEQKVGFYECGKCHAKYIPSFKQINFSMHVGRTRYMKCPHCKKCSWNKKVLK